MAVLLGVIAIAMVRLIAHVLTPLLEDPISESGRLALRMMGVKRRREATICMVLGGASLGYLALAILLVLVRRA